MQIWLLRQMLPPPTPPPPMAHPPQLVGSVWVFVQRVPAPTAKPAGQLVSGAMQVPTVHVPPSQTLPAAQALAHEPQFAGSAAISVRQGKTLPAGQVANPGRQAHPPFMQYCWAEQ